MCERVIPPAIARVIGDVDVEGCWASVMHILRNEDQPYPENEAQAIQDVALNLASLASQALNCATQLLTDDVWSDHPKYSREDWAYEVGARDTQLGYWQWVLHKLQGEEEG